MKYDPEYNSYRFSSDELSMIVKSLAYYRKFHAPNSIYESLEMAKLIDNLYKSQNVTIDLS